FVEKIIEKKTFIICIIILTMILGAYSYIKMPKQRFPEVILPVAAVTAVYPGASAEDMEELVTKKVEETVMSLDGFDSCTSSVHENYCTVTVALDMDLSQKEVDDSFDDLRLKLSSLKQTLPDGVTQISVNTDIMDTAGLLVAVTADNVSGDELSQRATELKDQLKTLDGVKKVDLYGEQLSEVKVTVDVNKLNAVDLSLSDLSAIISAQNSMIPAGNINMNKDVITVSSNGKFDSIDEIKDIVVGSSKSSGIIYRLSDIATVEKSIPDDTPRFYYNGKPSALVALSFDKGINIVTMTDSIRSTIKDFSETLPDNIKVHEVYLQSDVIEKAINDFVENLIEAIILVMLVVMVCINLRNSLVVSIAIPLSIFSTFILMPYFGVDIQFISLAALIVVLGMLVDNSIVVSDSIQSRLDNGDDRYTAAINGTAVVARPVIISMLVAVAGFSSILTLTGSYRQLVFSLPVVVITSLVICGIVSLLVTPLMSYLFLKKQKGDKEDKFQKVSNFYDKYFQRAFQNPKAAIIVALVFLIVCASSIILLEPEVVPKANKDVITIEVIGDSENGLDNMEDVVKQIQQIL
ncbi:MAG TPA: efflux RND transporter permease subunit, partial [Anaerovoracaceae bacterium]|nr:efflux RND transporter permease subunit [Anaerovoracaceae bacterium]